MYRSAKLSHSPFIDKFIVNHSWIMNRLLDVLVCITALYYMVRQIQAF